MRPPGSRSWFRILGKVLVECRSEAFSGFSVAACGQLFAELLHMFRSQSRVHADADIGADAFARAVVFAMSQPEDVDINEILSRTRSNSSRSEGGTTCPLEKVMESIHVSGHHVRQLAGLGAAWLHKPLTMSRRTKPAGGA